MAKKGKKVLWVTVNREGLVLKAEAKKPSAKQQYDFARQQNA